MATYTSIVDQVLRPSLHSDLKEEEPYNIIKIQIFRNRNEPTTPTEELEIDNLYPFNTVYDLLTQIYILKGQAEEYHPYNLCLLMPKEVNEEIVYKNLQSVYYNDKQNEIFIKNPFLLKGIDDNFVYRNGLPKENEIVATDSLTLKTTVYYSQKEHILHLFLYRDILAKYNVAFPINNLIWNGAFRIYFPRRRKEDEDGSLPEFLTDDIESRITRFQESLHLINKINQYLVEESGFRVPGEKGGDPVNLSNYKIIRFAWNPVKPISIESLFFEMEVTKNIPYIRYFPHNSTPISKIHVESAFNIPSVNPPEVLIDWAKENSITPHQDMMVIKFLIRPQRDFINSLYGTFYIFQDGSAKAVIQPNKDEKVISRGELSTLGTILEEVTNAIPKLLPENLFPPENCTLDEAYIVLSMWLDIKETPLTSKYLKELTNFFRPFFQNIPSPIRDQNPLAFLRYKSVDNFKTPSREYQFYRRVIDLLQQGGESTDILPKVSALFMKEFNYSESEANARVSDLVTKDLEFELTNPEIREITQKDNPGNDISIFAKHPQYFFHLYRIDSFYTLQTIKTLLSLLVTIPLEWFSEAEEEAADVLEDEEREDIEEAEGIEKVEEAEPQISLKAAVDAAKGGPLDEELGFEDDGLGDLLLGDADAASVADSVASLAKEEEEFDGVEEKPHAKPTEKKPLEMKKPVVEEEEASDDEGGKKADRYFINRLNRYDEILFSYEDEADKVKAGKAKKKSTKGYARKCQANGRQPIVMSEDEYKAMRQEYEEDEEAGDVLWIDYPLNIGEDAPKKEKKSTEDITTLRYGSNLLPGKANIYICSNYWCKKDNMVILKKDFEATVDRKGNPKPENTCPFCKGRLVTDPTNVIRGETVIQRQVKKDGNKDQDRVGFLGKYKHPSGFSLPCCFTAQKKITKADEAYKGKIIDEEILEEEEDEEESTLPLYSYKKKLNELKDAYIVGPEKFPLEVSKTNIQVGVLPPLLDSYFGQNGQNLLKGGKLKTDTYGKPNVSGFFRIAADNKFNLANSLFSAVAPYFGYNTGGEIIQQILQQVIPPIFISLNYGNLLHEFHNPFLETPNDYKKKLFIGKYLKIPDSALFINKEEVNRAYKSWLSFQDKIQDSKFVKEYRTFAPLFSQPILISADGSKRGILFIVLDTNKAGELIVRCPPYGISPDMASRCDIAFISYYSENNMWEPIFYTMNNAKEGVEKSIFVFRRISEKGWPDIVKQRVSEYMKMCKSSGLGVYTDSPNITPKTLLSLSDGMSLASEEYSVYGILRDMYNHVSGVLFENQENQIVSLPVIDNGVLFPATKVEIDWRNYKSKLPSLSTVIDFYTNVAAPLLKAKGEEVSRSYTLEQVIRLNELYPEDPEVFALRLGNGLYIPFRKKAGEELPSLSEEPPKIYYESKYEEDVEELSYSTFGEELAARKAAGEKIAYKEQIQIITKYKKKEEKEKQKETQALDEESVIGEIPWSTNSKIVFGNINPDIDTDLSRKEFEEIYQHLRLTFANWLALVGGTLKDEINEILFFNGMPNPNLPLYEKRKRLDIKFGMIVRSWLDSSLPVFQSKPSVKRVDCRVTAQEKCSGKCVWREDDKKCLLHIPNEHVVGKKSVSAETILVNRLIEELIRFPEKRRELLSNKVGKYQILTQPIRSENEYLIPEDSPEWTEFLRMEWRRQEVDKPKYYEEFIMIDSESKIDKTPEYLNTLIKDKEGNPFYIFYDYTKPPSIFNLLESNSPFTKNEFMKKTGIDISDKSTILDTEEIKKIASELNYSVIQIEFEPGVAENPTILNAFYTNKESKETTDIFIFVILPDERIGVLSKDSTTFIPISAADLPYSFKIKMKKINRV